MRCTKSRTEPYGELPQFANRGGPGTLPLRATFPAGNARPRRTKHGERKDYSPPDVGPVRPGSALHANSTGAVDGSLSGEPMVKRKTRFSSGGSRRTGSGEPGWT